MAYHATNCFTGGSYPFQGGYIFVEFFFMVSGYYLIKGLEEGKVKNITEYMKKRCMQFFPYTTIVIVITYIWIAYMTVSWKGRVKLLMRLPLEISLLSNMHFTYTAVGWLWYIAAMLFVTPFICYLYLRHKELFKRLVWAVPIVWYGHCFSKLGYLSVERTVGNDLMRASSELLLGGGIFYLARSISKRKIPEMAACLFRIAGWGLFIVAIILSYRLHQSEYDLYCIVCFFIALVLIESGIAADIKWKGLNFLSNLSMGLYFFHGFPAKVITKYPLNASVLERYVLFFITSFIGAAILLKAGGKLREYCNKILNGEGEGE